MKLFSALQTAISITAASVVGYFLFIGLLAIPVFQRQAIYLNHITLTWFQDLGIPEQWGFPKGQVTPFRLSTPDGETIHAWHILPLGLYLKHEHALIAEPAGGFIDHVANRLSFQLLRDDPSALLVLHLHGAAGTLGSGFRPPSYRAMSALAPDKIHTVAIDYRGFGGSTGTPSEAGLLTDALTLAEWAMHSAGIPPSRIVLFGQSLGTAVAIALARHLADNRGVLFSGMVLVAPFADVERLTATYRLAGTIPVLGPLAAFPRLLAFFNGFVLHKWPSKDALVAFVGTCETMAGAGRKYHITAIHAQDDYDIPWSHSDQVFWHAVRAARAPRGGVGFEELEREKDETKTSLGAAGWSVKYETARGVIREEIATWGLHDRIMSYPLVSLAVLRAFEEGTA